MNLPRETRWQSERCKVDGGERVDAERDAGGRSAIEIFTNDKHT